MRALEYLNAKPSVDQIDTAVYWSYLDPILTEKGMRPLDHIEIQLKTTEDEVFEMPDELFDPNGDEASPLRRTHALLDAILDGPRQPYTEAIAREIYPYWRKQLADAREILGTL